MYVSIMSGDIDDPPAIPPPTPIMPDMNALRSIVLPVRSG